MDSFTRFTLNERIQHIVFLLSFTVLIITGFSLTFNNFKAVEGLIALMGGFEIRSLIHRIAAVVMVGVSIYHIFYLSLTHRGREQLNEIIPKIKDVTDFINMLKYFVYLRKEKPKLGRFSYMEKAEYWAAIWGVVIMTITGFMMWFEDLTISYLSMLGFDIACVVHLLEAILASLAILVWHLYNVHFSPGNFPMNWSWLTGKISKEKMIEEHPLEYEKITQE